MSPRHSAKGNFTQGKSGDHLHGSDAGYKAVAESIVWSCSADVSSVPWRRGRGYFFGSGKGRRTIPSELEATGPRSVNSSTVPSSLTTHTSIAPAAR